jgi:hypothetical protein
MIRLPMAVSFRLQLLKQLGLGALQKTRSGGLQTAQGEDSRFKSALLLGVEGVFRAPAKGGGDETEAQGIEPCSSAQTAA